MRVLPFQLLWRAIQKFNKAGSPAVFYIHPGELDPLFPLFPHTHRPSYYQWGMNWAAKKFASVLREFRFTSAHEAVVF
jgi:hypothetical protein